MSTFDLSSSNASAEPPASDLDPFAPIEAVPTSPLGGGAPTSYQIRLEDDTADRGFRTVGTLPARQLLVSNRELRTMAREIAGQMPWTWRPVKTFFDGTRFAYALSTNDLFRTVTGGDPLCVGLLFQNSYDGTWEVGCRLFAYRLLSTTGLLHEHHFGCLGFGHSLTSDKWATEVQRGRRYLHAADQKLQQFVVRCRQLRQHEITASHLAALRRGSLSRLSTRRWGQLLDRYLIHASDRTAWSLLTAGTRLMWAPTEPVDKRDFHYNRVLTEAVVGRISARGPAG